jgi:hypothetical protein
MRRAIGLVFRSHERLDQSAAMLAAPMCCPAYLAAERLFRFAGSKAEPTPEIGERVLDVACLGLRGGAFFPNGAARRAGGSLHRAPGRSAHR